MLFDIFRKKYYPQNELLSSDSVYKLKKKLYEINKKSTWYQFLKKRYSWMDKHLNKNDTVIEIGAASGISRHFIDKNIILTDVIDYPWIDKIIDANNIDFCDGALDAVIAVDTIHHLQKPALFFDECTRILKKGGKIIISEINLSLYARIGLRILKFEGWDIEKDVFNRQSIINDGISPWSGNNAVSRLLFDDIKLFEKNFPKLKIEKIENKFCICHLLSGGAMTNLNSINIYIYI